MMQSLLEAKTVGWILLTAVDLISACRLPRKRETVRKYYSRNKIIPVSFILQTIKGLKALTQ